MKLEHLSEYLTITIVTILGMGLALYLGASTGGGNSQIPGIVIGGSIALMVALVMKAKIWILIPFFWSMDGKISGMPGGIPLRDLIIIYVFAVFLALKALKVIRTKFNFDWLDYLLIANILYLVTVYIRNPVGTLSMGFDLVGGRPYFESIFALMAFCVLGHVTIKSDLAWKMPWLCTYSSIIASAGAFIANQIPATAPILSKIYSNWRDLSVHPFGENAPAASPDSIEIDRPGYALIGGQAILRALYSIYSPLTTINPLYIVRFVLATLSLVAILLSGFRSGLMYTFLFFLVSVYFRHGLFSIFKMAVICVPLLAFIVIAQGNLIALPYSMQRTLSFLPGKWEDQVRIDAQRSTDWRVEIWEKVLDPDNRYITNWWFGDGFGMTKQQVIESIQFWSESQENLTLSGDYHSLPLTTIHTVGYVGGTLFAILMLSMAVYAWKLIRRAEKTPFYWFTLFVGIPIILDPLFGILIFGAFKSQIVVCIYGVAMLRLASRSLDAYKLESNLPAKPNEFPEVALSGFAYPIRPI